MSRIWGGLFLWQSSSRAAAAVISNGVLSSGQLHVASSRIYFLKMVHDSPMQSWRGQLIRKYFLTGRHGSSKLGTKFKMNLTGPIKKFSLNNCNETYLGIKKYKYRFWKNCSSKFMLEKQGEPRWLECGCESAKWWCYGQKATTMSWDLSRKGWDTVPLNLTSVLSMVLIFVNIL